MEVFHVTQFVAGDEVVLDTKDKAAEACQEALKQIRAGKTGISVMGTERGIIAIQNPEGRLQSTGN